MDVTNYVSWKLFMCYAMTGQDSRGHWSIVIRAKEGRVAAGSVGFFLYLIAKLLQVFLIVNFNQAGHLSIPMALILR